MDNLTDSLKAPIQWNRTTYKQTLPISFSPPAFDSKLLTTPKTLKRLCVPNTKEKGNFCFAGKAYHYQIRVA